MTEGAEKKYPVSEIFTSPQGEGLYAGTLMTFVKIHLKIVSGKKVLCNISGTCPTSSKPQHLSMQSQL